MEYDARSFGTESHEKALLLGLKYNLMINHDSIEISDKIFGVATPAQKEFNAFQRVSSLNL